MTQVQPTNYRALNQQLNALLEGENHLIAILSNSSALINEHLNQINWVGFYLIENNELILGPFQGRPACVHIKIGSGVCGMAVKEKQIQRVADVTQFKGHIACDVNSKSEIVLPVRKNGEIIGVLDIDAPITDRFTQTDEEGLSETVKVIERFI
ncbi:GAF domain-containing protein [Staphylococcus sp. SQ8-PEA]|uniref:GAF domain-containing protein n=1 Tax=Staphylococcus marylandisciuri TaxID=2981529 RepID=A0ABT2QQ61_9STAP|nr:GAF domain-containing protein [Staphylococcus marylandisciuri]MCU5746118.1 GAF domain-containing protein [Staphylococcus marylandisciuri]